MSRLLLSLLPSLLPSLLLWAAVSVFSQAVLAQETAPAKAEQATPAPLMGSIDQQALLDRIAARDDSLLILDVRTADEYAQGHVEGALHIPYDQLPQRATEIEAAKDKDIVLYCRSGRRSEVAAETLKQKGFTRLLHLEGDYLAWEAADRPVAR